MKKRYWWECTCCHLRTKGHPVGGRCPERKDGCHRYESPTDKDLVEDDE